MANRICTRCGDDIAEDGDREQAADGGFMHHISTCFEIVKAQRDELRAVMSNSKAPPEEKAAKKAAKKAEKKKK
jgi:hypothetical protein